MKHELTFKEKEELLEYHFSQYHSVQRRLKFSMQWCEVGESQVNPMELAYVFTIEEAMGTLDAESYRIMYNDFIDRLAKNWWMEFYGKTTYYRLKQLSMDKFIRCLHE